MNGMFAGTLLLIALQTVERDVPPHQKQNFPCNIGGNTTIEITNKGTAPAAWKLAWAHDQNQSDSGSIDPGKTISRDVGCGGVGTPGMDFTNDSDQSMHVKTH